MLFMSQPPTYGPHNPHPLSTLRTELVWEGKYDEYGNRREVDIAGCAMPMQKVESIDEPRRVAAATGQLELFEQQNPKQDDFRNRQVRKANQWGNNKRVMASLLQEFKGKVDLIYIDPPFDVGADFSMSVAIGDEQEAIEKEQSTLEMVAYRDIWGKGTDSYLHMLYERLTLISELLSEKGSIFVHCDWHVNYMARTLLDDVFGSERFVNEIVWYYYSKMQGNVNRFAANHDIIFWYSKSPTDTEHRRVILEFFKAEVLTSTPSPLLHGRKAGASCHVDDIDSMFTREEAKQVAQATAQAGGRECYCLAWEFEMDLHLLVNALVQELGVKLKLVQIPREITEKNRKSPPPFLEVAVLAAEPVYRSPQTIPPNPPSKGGSGSEVPLIKGDLGGSLRAVDIKLTQFLPSLAEVPTKELEAIKERAITSGFDFIDFWAVDFNWHPGKPFTHDWQDYRTRKDRSLKTISDAGYTYPAPGKYRLRQSRRYLRLRHLDYCRGGSMNFARNEARSEDFSPHDPEITTEVVTTNDEVGGTCDV